uniref:Transthyretin-like protein 5 n=1 Tax=Ditylenchus dipsaci TaxID=166011 RepID=A0A915E729_9BILA
MQVFYIVCFALFLQCVQAIGIGRKQSAGIKGELVCDGKPAAGVKVKLYDDDRGLDADDLLASGKTDRSGHFELEGYTHEITTIDPKLNIYHDCNDGLTPCQRKVSVMIPDKYVSTGEHPERMYELGVFELSVEIPDKYVSDGEHPKRMYDAGRIELSGKFKGEARDCLN